MKTRWMTVLGLLGSIATAGCSTYHYYDIDVQFGTVTLEQASILQLCDLRVSGADSHEAALPSSTVADSTTVCPVDRNWPDMGKFEYATFADSGAITFAVSGYKSLPAGSDTLCTSGSVTLTASGTITQSGTITMGAFDDAKCPSSVVRP